MHAFTRGNTPGNVTVYTDVYGLGFPFPYYCMDLWKVARQLRGYFLAALGQPVLIKPATIKTHVDARLSCDGQSRDTVHNALDDMSNTSRLDETINIIEVGEDKHRVNQLFTADGGGVGPAQNLATVAEVGRLIPENGDQSLYRYRTRNEIQGRTVWYAHRNKGPSGPLARSP